MSFKEITGHQEQLNQIKNAIRNQKVPHAYLFSGTEGIGKKKIAYEFIKYLNCENPNIEEVLSCEQCSSCLRTAKKSQPDYFEIQDQDGSIKIDQVRNIAANLSLKNILTKYKCVIIDNCELITSEAANSLLKVIEEPTQNTIFFLITSNENKLLPTILSRTQKIAFKDLTREELLELASKNNIYKDNMDFLVDFAQGSFSRLKELVEDEELLEELRIYRELFSGLEEKPIFQIINQGKIFEKDRKKLQRFLDFFIFFLERSYKEKKEEKGQDVYSNLKGLQVKAIVEEIIVAQKMLSRNINSRFIGEMLLIKTKSILKG